MLYVISKNSFEIIMPIPDSQIMIDMRRKDNLFLNKNKIEDSEFLGTPNIEVRILNNMLSLLRRINTRLRSYKKIK